MGALRVNSSLDTWEIECISCEALSLFILELINYFAMIGLLGWFSWMSWLFGSPYVRCYPFLLFLDVHWEICECFCLSPSDILGFCSLFHFAQECKRLSMGGFDVPLFSPISQSFLHHFNYWLVLIVKLIRQFYYLGSLS